MKMAQADRRKGAGNCLNIYPENYCQYCCNPVDCGRKLNTVRLFWSFGSTLFHFEKFPDGMRRPRDAPHLHRIDYYCTL